MRKRKYQKRREKKRRKESDGWKEEGRDLRERLEREKQTKRELKEEKTNGTINERNYKLL